MDRKKTDSSRHRPLDRRGWIIFAGYVAAVLVMTVSTETCFAANDPLAVVNDRTDPAGVRYRAGGTVAQEP